jgi:hypothetical protein
MKIISFIILFIISLSSFAQQKEIVLMGTIHLKPSSLDMYKNKEIDLNSSKRKAEIKYVVDKIVQYHPSKILVEWPKADQAQLDSIFNLYLSGNYKLKKNERDLFAFQACKALNVKPIAITHSYAGFSPDSAKSFAEKNNQKNIIENLNNIASKFMQTIDSNLANMSLKDFLLWANSSNAINTNASFYSQYFASIGNHENYVGADVLTEWYKSNIYIHSNILKAIDETDQKILVIYGQGHMAILHHLLESNKAYKIKSLDKVLK